MTPQNVVFDIGGVLVNWQPHLAWSPELGVDGAKAFIERVGFMALNVRGDGGERFADLALEVAAPEDRQRVADYVSLYTRTVPEAISGTWALLDRLKTRGVAVHAITNWSHETWPEGLKVHPRLGEVFETLVVSGQEGMMKPDKRIFELLCTRAGVAPETCLFIDDSPKNVEGAKAAGWDAVQFTTPDALESDLMGRGLM